MKTTNELTFDELVTYISGQVLSDLLTDGGPGIKRGVHFGLLVYADWLEHQKPTKEAK